MSLTHIETIELGSSQSSITFSSIPQDYDDLVLLSSARTDRAQSVDSIDLQPNGLSANRSTVSLFGDGSSAASSSGSDLRAGNSTGSAATANTFGNGTCYISNYTKSQAKSISMDTVSEDNDTFSVQIIDAGLWNDTSSITSLVLSPSNGTNIVAGSTFSLYGVTAGGDGTVTTA